MTISRSDRPLSPHLQVYKPQISSVLSILHRATGVVLSFGVLLLVAWLFGAAYNAELFDTLNSFFHHWAGLAVLGGWTFAFYYHLANGIRHLVWDTGRGFDLKSLTRGGLMVLLFSFAATGWTWYVILFKRGICL